MEVGLFAVSVSHAGFEVLTPDVEVVVPLNNLFAVGKPLLKLAFGFDTGIRGQERQGEKSGLHCWAEL